jgi:hypothetical protein
MYFFQVMCTPTATTTTTTTTTNNNNNNNNKHLTGIDQPALRLSYELEDRRIGFRIPAGAMDFFLFTSDRRRSPPRLLLNGYRGLFSQG